MSFFKRIDDLGIVEHHAKQVTALQEDQAAIVLREYKDVRMELVDRLHRFGADTFTAQHLRGVLAQVDAAIITLTKRLHENMSDAAYQAAHAGLTQLEKEIASFSEHFTGAVIPINLNAVTAASDTKNFLVNQYKASLDAYSADLRSQMTRNLTHAVVAQTPYAKVVQGISRFFSGEEWKLHRIVRTELHNVYGSAKITGLREVKKEVLPKLKKALYHPMDTRTGEDSIELAEENPIIDIDKPFRQVYKASPKSKTQVFVFMHPPNRPNDRAILIPYDKSWGPAGEQDTEDAED